MELIKQALAYYAEQEARNESDTVLAREALAAASPKNLPD